MNATATTGQKRLGGRFRWLFRDVDAAAAEAFGSLLGIGPITARVLYGRGMRDAAAARRFLNPALEDLHDPSPDARHARGGRTAQKATVAREKILVYGDYDVDGTTSVVVLKTAIELAGGVALFHVPDRFKEGYGMRAEVVERASAEGVSLIVSVDTGIRAGDVVRRAAALGIDVIVTDHHLPEAELPPALAVLNPNQPDCPYPEKNLCGVGVAFKLAQGLLQTLDWPADKLRRILRSFLKLVAIGTVADVVPLTGENRIIVRHGLEGLCVVKNAGLRALLKVAGLAEGAAPTAGQVAFQVAPRINAAGRMATAADVIELLLTTDVDRAKTLAEQLDAFNADRQRTEAQIVQSILEECSRIPVTESQAALVFAGDGWHRGVLGIVAARLVERFHRPAFVLGHTAEDGLAQGSGRSIAAFHLLEALERMPELFTKFGGHFHAAGLTMPSNRVDEFRERLNAHAAGLLTPEDFIPGLNIDASVELERDHQPGRRRGVVAPSLRSGQRPAAICRARCRGDWRTGLDEGKACPVSGSAGQLYPSVEGLELPSSARRKLRRGPESTSLSSSKKTPIRSLADMPAGRRRYGICPPRVD